MTDQRADQLLPCPFCGAGETILEPDSKHWTGMRWNVLSYRVRHWCPSPSATGFTGALVMRAKTEDQARAMWNKRVSV